PALHLSLHDALPIYLPVTSPHNPPMNTWMDQSEAVERNRQAVLSVVAALFSMAGLSAVRSTLPRRVYRTILRLLRPAESAARRLVIALAQGLDVGSTALRPHRWGSARRSSEMLARSAVALPMF